MTETERDRDRERQRHIDRDRERILGGLGWNKRNRFKVGPVPVDAPLLPAVCLTQYCEGTSSLRCRSACLSTVKVPALFAVGLPTSVL